MLPKPPHLGPMYAAQFEDESVAREYQTRPPYPGELLDVLGRLMPTAPRCVLDLGCGTGDVGLGLLGRADRIDAVDRSGPMLRVAMSRHRSGDRGLYWIKKSAETFRPPRQYSLIVAAESLHWMDWEVVFRWLPDALLPGAVLALVSGRELDRLPWSAELPELIALYSTNQEYRPYDLVEELTKRGVFVELGCASTAAIGCHQTVEQYVESFHTRNGFSRQRMTAAAADEFDAGLRRLVFRYSPDGWVRSETRAKVVWGTPRRPTRG